MAKKPKTNPELEAARAELEALRAIPRRTLEERLAYQTAWNRVSQLHAELNPRTGSGRTNERFLSRASRHVVAQRKEEQARAAAARRRAL